MNHNKLTFESENLVIDWFSFNIKNCKNSRLLGEYLFGSLQFNVFEKKKQLEKAEKLFWDKNNSYSCVFVQIQDPYWEGVILSFSGQNAAHFYHLLQSQKVNWSLFDLKKTNLGRLDIRYFQTANESSIFTNDFFEKARKKLDGTRRVVSYRSKKSSNSQILRIGNRRSPRFYRIYGSDEGLTFELEIKSKLANSFQADLFENRISEFEKKVMKEFFMHSGRILPLNNYYSNWLLVYLRKNPKKTRSDLSVVTTYLENSGLINSKNRELLWQFFQLLSFLHVGENTQNYTKVKKVLSKKLYYDITFSLNDFLEFTGRKKNQYQLSKTKTFFQMFYDLQKTQQVIAHISDICFRSYVPFPSFFMEKTGKFNSWKVYISLSEEFYHYPYPFIFPIEFAKFEGKYDQEVKMEILYLFSQINSEKYFDFKTFLSKFSISNMRKTQIKKKIIDLLFLLKEKECIESDFVFKNTMGETLSTKNLKLIYFNKFDSLTFFENTSFFG